MKPIKEPGKAALILGFVTAFCFAPRGGLQPYFAHSFPASVWMLPSLGFLTGLAALILLGVSAVRRKMFFPALLVIGVCFSVCYYSMNGKWAEAAWRKEFADDRSRLDRAVSWASREKARADARRDWLPLPSEFADLSARGEALRWRGSDGKTWYLFSPFLHGLGDGVGFAWSKSGEPPPRNSASVFKAKPLGEGWYLIWMT